ncbi:MAG: hypothetical protein RQ899_09765 [Pseudomonadales bacterium]|nr:hypothetical protein [Pseudomonadales bacterium]
MKIKASMAVTVLVSYGAFSADSRAADAQCYWAPIGGTQLVQASHTAAEFANSTYVGIFAELNSNVSPYSTFGNKVKSPVTSSPRFAWSLSPAYWDDYMDITTAMVTLWDGNYQGASVRDMSTFDDCSSHTGV